jgi:hypothetical protein
MNFLCGDSHEFTWSIHMDRERLDYAVTRAELNELCNAAGNTWKDFCLVAVSLAIPCLINAITDIQQQQSSFDLTVEIFLNSLIGVVAIGLGVPFAIMWRKTAIRVKTLRQAIEDKPKVEVVVDDDEISLR